MTDRPATACMVAALAFLCATMIAAITMHYAGQHAETRLDRDTQYAVER